MNTREIRQKCNGILRQVLPEVASNEKNALRTACVRKGVEYEIKEALSECDSGELIQLAKILHGRASRIRDFPKLQEVMNAIVNVLIKIAEALVPKSENVIFLEFKPVSAKPKLRGECGKIIQFPRDWLSRMMALDPTIGKEDMMGLDDFFGKYMPPAQEHDGSKK